MPPEQCPACGRFLRKDLIASLALGPKPCPRCDVPLTSVMFDAAAEVSDPPAQAEVPEPPVAEVPEPPVADVLEPPVAAAVAPPADELPSSVLGTAHDPLVGWDPQGYEARTTDVLQAEDRTPLLTAGGAASGALVGFVALGRTRSRGALLGALVGAVTGIVVSRMTRPVD